MVGDAGRDYPGRGARGRVRASVKEWFVTALRWFSISM
jgi:hypothetical protein